MKETTKKGNSLLPAGLLIGALVGAVAGVLLAPASGAENRKKLKELSIKLKDDIEKKLKEAKEVSQDSYNKIVDGVVAEYSKKEPIIKENALKLKKALMDRFKKPTA